MDTEKRKRGRKPKNEEQTPVSGIYSNMQANESVSKDCEKKKRGRKPKSVYTTNDNHVLIANNCLSDDENVIVRLTVTEEVEDSLDINDLPHAYNYNFEKYNIMEYNEMETPTEEIVRQEHADEHNLKIVEVLKDFEQKNKNNEWPSNTSICCYWCCHKFSNAPFGIPVSYHNENFDVYGCFCSLECAAAYNFKSTESLDEIWERYSLINLLSRRIKYGRVVKPAPDRLTLKMFGGFLDIDSFRSYNSTNKIVSINFPPMTSLTQQIEEINEYELNSDLKYIPIDSERINRCKEKMIFKRNKPIINEKATLKSSMNMKIS